MTASGQPNRSAAAQGPAARVGAWTGLGALVLACLTLSPNPPPEALGTRLGGLVGKGMGLSLSGAFLASLVLGLTALVVMTLLSIQNRLRGKRKEDETWVRWKPRPGKGILLVVALGLAAAFMAVLGLTWLEQRMGYESARATAPTPSAAPAPVQQPPAIGRTEATNRLPLYLGSALVAALLALVASRWFHARPAVDCPATSQPSPWATIRRRLELGDPSRDAIIACYAEMCWLFEGHERLGAPGLTAREFAALLRSKGAEEPEILTLTGVFEKARYSLEPCLEWDRILARDALARIEASHATSPARQRRGQ